MGYRAGLALSRNGIHWTRVDDAIDMGPSGSGWDSEVICYPVFYEHDDRLYIFYNGNGFGRTGFGAVEVDKLQFSTVIWDKLKTLKI